MTALCNHGYFLHDCALCVKRPGECDFGSCEQPATCRVETRPMCDRHAGRGFDRATWETIISRGSLNVGNDRVSVDIRRGLPSLTITGYPDLWSARVVSALREDGWLLPFRLTICLSPAARRGMTMSDVASEVRALFVRAESVAQAA